jgi:hypothetical protein
MHLHQDPNLAREEEEEERKPSRVGEKKERDALMEKGSLREGERASSWRAFHGHGNQPRCSSPPPSSSSSPRVTMRASLSLFSSNPRWILLPFYFNLFLRLDLDVGAC